MISILKRAALVAIMSLTASVCSFAVGNEQEAGKFDYSVRIGYEVGGTAPLGMPASIRGLNSFQPRANILVGGDAHYAFSSRWGLMASLWLENKGMRTDAKVKNYSMEMRQGTDNITGRFTGNVVTEVDEWMISIPVMAAFEAHKVRVKVGPYVSWVFDGNFSGYAYDGYLRNGTPTGAKVLIGNDETTRGDYDFSSDMRKCQFGVAAGADWHFGRHLGTFLNLSWGLTGVFNDDFKTIEQTMYPIYGSVGLLWGF